MKAKAYVKVGPHRRAFPKRKFADGGVSANGGSGRPDLDLLARQGLSPGKAPGMPPRIIQEHLLGDWSGADTGNRGTVQRVERAGEDLPGRPGGSVLNQMMDRSADRVQTAHDDARAQAAIRAAHDRPAKRFADGGASTSGDDAGPYDSWEAERQKEQYGFSPASAMMRGLRTAESAAPAASTLPPSDVSAGLPPAITSDDAGPMTASAPVVAPAPSTPATPPVAALPAPSGGPPGATLTGTKSTPGQGNAGFQKNSPEAQGMDWRKIAAAGLKGATSGTGALAAIGGAALGSYLKNRNRNGGDATTSASQGKVYSPNELTRRRGTADAYSMPDLSGTGTDYAKGGEVGPSNSDRGMRGARPMRRPMGGPPSYTPPPGSAPTFPGGVGQVTPQYGPPGGGSQMTPIGAGGPSNAQMAAASATPPSMGAQMGHGMPPGGPPPQSMMGPMAGGPPPGGPPPGAGSITPMSGGDPRAAMMAGLQRAQQNTQQSQNGPPLTSANSGWVAPNAPPDFVNPQPTAEQLAMQNSPAAQAARAAGFAKGGHVIEDTEGFSPRAKHERVRQFGDVGKPAEKLPPEKKKKGGKIKHRAPFGGAKKAVKAPPVPMVTDEDMGDAPAPPAAMGAPAGPMPEAAPMPAPAGPPPGMAEGGVAKLRRGYPNTKGTAKVKKMATGGSVRGCGAARKGKGFSGVY